MHSDNNHNLREMDIGAMRYYVNDLVVLLQYLCIWPREQKFPTFLLMAISWLMCVLLTVFEVAASVVYFEVRLFANCIASFGFHATGVIKWIFCVRKIKGIAGLYVTLNECHGICTSDMKTPNKYYEKEMESVRYNISVFIRIWSILIGYGVFHWCSNPLFVGLFIKYIRGLPVNATSVPRLLPYFAWHPWNTNTMYGYLIAYAFQLVGGIGGGVGILAFDVIYITTLMVIGAQLRYLNVSLRMIGDTSYRETRSDFSLQRELRTSALHHVTLMKLIDDLEILVSPVMFTQCIETLVVICLLSLEASTIEVTNDMECVLKLWSMFEYFSATCLQLYLFCLFATEIKTLGLQVADSVGFCGWETMENNKNKLFASSRRNLLDIRCLVGMITMRAQKPVILTGGPFYELSLETFRGIVGMAISNSVILRQVSEN